MVKAVVLHEEIESSCSNYISIECVKPATLQGMIKIVLREFWQKSIINMSMCVFPPSHQSSPWCACVESEQDNPSTHQRGQ